MNAAKLSLKDICFAVTQSYSINQNHMNATFAKKYSQIEEIFDNIFSLLTDAINSDFNAMHAENGAYLLMAIMLF